MNELEWNIICLNISHIARLRHKRYKLSWWAPICSEEASNISNCWALGKKADMQPGAAINKSQIFSENIQHLWNIEMKYFCIFEEFSQYKW